MKRRLFAALAASALMIATALPATALAAKPTRGFERVDVNKLDKTLIQRILAGRDVDVIVEFAAAPAAQKQLTRAQRVSTAKALKQAQDKLDGRIKKLGGKVQAKYQYTLNAVKLRVSGTKVADLAKLPNVKAIHPVTTYRIDNVRGVPFIGAPKAWTDYGATGTGQTIAVIDTGIDYTHANFGGPGTSGAYDANDSTVTTDGGFPTAKVIGGWDFVGDDYDPEATNGDEVPQPDPDPLDCNGHGSHVAGSAAGFGVKADHSTYTGAYNATTYQTSFGIGPGVAPKAKLVALKVFGCDDGTNVVTDALEWVGTYNATHSDAIDVVNMSLGGIGGPNTPDALAVDMLVASGVSVVTSTGNEGPNAYMTGSPGNANGALAVAALDAVQNLPGAIVDRTSGADINGINQSNSPNLPVTGTLQVIADDPTTPTLPDGSGNEFLGCAAADYGTLPANSIAVVQRGVCAFVDKGAAAEEAGAIGLIVINRDDRPATELPAYLGYTPELFDIPMIGVANAAKAALVGSDGVGATLKAGPGLANPTYKQVADFSSGGPRYGDSGNKPDVNAPGVNVVSTAVGLGFKGTTKSGTSMAAPHVAGVAALVRQRHPTWAPEAVKAVIVQTATASLVDYDARLLGSGMVQPRRAVDSFAYALAGDGTPSLSFGYDPLRIGTYNETRSFTLYNRGRSAISFTLSAPTGVTLDRTSVTVPGFGRVVVKATLRLLESQLAAMPSVSSSVPDGTDLGAVNSLGGVITAKPTKTATGLYTLRIAYRAVPRAASNIAPTARTPWASAAGLTSSILRLRNTGVHYGWVDTYAWGLSDPRDLPAATTATNDIRAVGLQVLPSGVLLEEDDPDDRALIFAINTYGHWSGAYGNSFTIAIFGSDPDPESFVITLDAGLAGGGDFDGQVLSLVVAGPEYPDTDFEEGDIVDAWLADAPNNGSTILVPLLASDIARTDPGATVDYEVLGENITGEAADAFVDEVEGRATLSVFEPAVSTGDFEQVDRGASLNLPLVVDDAAFADHPTKGWMIVTLDDMNGAAQADLVPADQPS